MERDGLNTGFAARKPWSTLFAVAMAVALAACGSASDETTTSDHAAGTDLGAVKTEDVREPAATDDGGEQDDPSGTPAEVDYADLRTWGCDRLLQVVSEVAGPGERTGTGFGDDWLEGTLEGGCEISGDVEVAIEIHLAEEDQHSLPFALLRPDSAEQRAAQLLDIADEAYADESGPTLGARKGLVEVHLSPPMWSDGTRIMSLDDMGAVAEEILAAWPSGPGADGSPAGAPPDVPLPARADPADWTNIDPAELNRVSVESGGPEVYPVELMPTNWFLPFEATPAEREDLCKDLEAAGYSPEPLADLYGKSFALDECSGSNGRWLVHLASAGSTHQMTVISWEQVVRKERICSDEDRLAGKDRFFCE